MITLTIDDKKVEVEDGSTILQAAQKHGIQIPTLCAFKSLAPYGACRVCLVEIVGPRDSWISASCVYAAQEGMVVKTDTERVLKTRRMMLELLLARCPEAPRIKEMAAEMGIDEPRFPKQNDDCILCGLCTRICGERMGVGAVSFVNRGSQRKVAVPYDKHSPICIACGACQVVCPTSAVDLSEVTSKEPRPIMSEYDMGLAGRPCIYIPFPQAIPKVAVIDREKCLHYLKGTCGSCELFCEAGAINYEQEDKIEQVDVGAVVLAPGYEHFDADLKKELGFARFPNVVSSMQFERFLSASGPHLGEILRPSDLTHPKKIAWIQCVGSREVDCDYCSSVCCMYATKEAIIAKEHQSDLECTIFFIDMRAFGKGFDAYYERAMELGVRYVRCRPSSIKQIPSTKDLNITYVNADSELTTEGFDMVVLSTGLRPPGKVREMAGKFGVELNEQGFADTQSFSPVETSKPGVYACGPFAGPKDIPETVMEASAGAGKAMALLKSKRGTLITHKEYPPEKDVSGQEPRIGVFVCHCGRNIGGYADVPGIVEYARTLPNVVYAEDNLYTCSTDTQKHMTELIAEQDLNRVVVASCSPRTHEPLFRDTCRQAGLNEYLFEMANIRDQCTWVHMNEPEEATRKSKDLVRMAVAKAALLEPLAKGRLKVNNNALVLGGGIAGMTSSLSLANQGFKVHLVEKERELGGNFRHIHHLFNGEDTQQKLIHTVESVKSHPQIEVHTESVVSDAEGSVGNFKSTIKQNGQSREVSHGAVIIATGAEEYQPTEYLYGENPKVITQRTLEGWIYENKAQLQEAKTIVMIQCVGSRDEERPYCSRVCCSEAVKNAIAVKDAHPEKSVYVLYRDIRTYGMREKQYTQARDKGVRFIRYEQDRKPEVSANNGALKVSCVDPILKMPVEIDCDLVALAAAIVPPEGAEDVGKLYKIPLNQDKFFLEAHMKLRPVDFASDGVFMCGLAHCPKSVEESLAQADAAAARAATILSKDEIEIDAVISQVVDENCDGCAYCIDPCPYKALTLIEYMYKGDIKKTVERDAALCKGCGVCQATCPKKGIFIRNFRLEQLGAMVDAALMGE
ncbi:MAG: FAD-dependent oxidoreductase [Planctomycetota bacterium]|jgi:heterodisulfide reductase subunit A